MMELMHPACPPTAPRGYGGVAPALSPRKRDPTSLNLHGGVLPFRDQMNCTVLVLPRVAGRSYPELDRSAEIRWIKSTMASTRGLDMTRADLASHRAIQAIFRLPSPSWAEPSSGTPGSRMRLSIGVIAGDRIVLIVWQPSRWASGPAGWIKTAQCLLLVLLRQLRSRLSALCAQYSTPTQTQ